MVVSGLYVPEFLCETVLSSNLLKCNWYLAQPQSHCASSQQLALKGSLWKLPLEEFSGSFEDGYAVTVMKYG